MFLKKSMFFVFWVVLGCANLEAMNPDVMYIQSKKIKLESIKSLVTCLSNIVSQCNFTSIEIADFCKLDLIDPHGNNILQNAYKIDEIKNRIRMLEEDLAKFSCAYFDFGGFMASWQKLYELILKKQNSLRQAQLNFIGNTQVMLNLVDVNDLFNAIVSMLIT